MITRAIVVITGFRELVILLAAQLATGSGTVPIWGSVRLVPDTPQDTEPLDKLFQPGPDVSWSRNLL
jgi:hypothetical protein